MAAVVVDGWLSVAPLNQLQVERRGKHHLLVVLANAPVGSGDKSTGISGIAG